MLGGSAIVAASAGRLASPRLGVAASGLAGTGDDGSLWARFDLVADPWHRLSVLIFLHVGPINTM